MAHTATFDTFQQHDTHDDTYSKKRDKGAKMNNNRIFDTLQYANRLKAAGVPEKQAEVQVEMMAEIIEDGLATKNDLEVVRSDLKKDIKELDLKIELVRKDIISMSKDITNMGYKTIIATGGMISVGVAILGFLIKLH